MGISTRPCPFLVALPQEFFLQVFLAVTFNVEFFFHRLNHLEVFRIGNFLYNYSLDYIVPQPLKDRHGFSAFTENCDNILGGRYRKLNIRMVSS